MVIIGTFETFPEPDIRGQGVESGSSSDAGRDRGTARVLAFPGREFCPDEGVIQPHASTTHRRMSITAQRGPNPPWSRQRVLFDTGRTGITSVFLFLIYFSFHILFL
jgi:hypothetical protein